ncbi:MAG: hypothetical protein LBO72_01770 [Helicobacteraceae bacterium]|jgi:hypothetical protein|nr:hypothetical protein [Helicobacteraceae bacterium]
MSLLSQSRAITAFVLSIGAIVSFSLLGCDSNNEAPNQAINGNNNARNIQFNPLSEGDALLESIELPNAISL